MASSKNILFVTTANLTTNPRLLKELQLMNKQYQCSFVGFRLGNWSDENDELIRKDLSSVTFFYLSALRKPFFPWLISSLVQKIAIYLGSVISQSLLLNALANDKRAWLLKQYFHRQSQEYDLIIAHNIGTLVPVWRYSKITNTPFSFDVEDYHPGELKFEFNQKAKAGVELMLKKVLPEALFITYASKPIGNAILDLVGEKNVYNRLYTRNSFYNYEFIEPTPVNGKVKFVWFSQYITEKRGLEVLVPLLEKYKDAIELTLIGELRISFFKSFLEQYPFVQIKQPLLQKELHAELSNYDVGLAVEIDAVDGNKGLTLSNKIFAYAQAGLFVFASDTLGQQQFINENEWVGISSKLSDQVIDQKLKWLIHNKEDIRIGKMDRYKRAKEFRWEVDAEKLADFINIS